MNEELEPSTDETTASVNPVQRVVMRWTWQDFRDGKVRIDFRGHSMAELQQLRKLCELVNPGRAVPAYSFGNCYYCNNGRWYEGANHNFVGHEVCRANDIDA